MEYAEVAVGPSELVALVNQTFDYAYPSITVTGELANLRVSKGKWLYFDVKDDSASVKFFGTVYMLPGPLEDGMLVKIQATPHLHNLYGFSMNVSSIRPAGEGSIKKAQQLLQAQLAAEGLFDADRKRPLPFPPKRIGLVASSQSAAYADFIKILSARWGGLQIELLDVQVQGEPAPGQITAAIAQFNAMSEPPDVLVLIRGGGSPEDLAAFSTEQVTRAVAASHIPTLVAIGHEIDVSLAELAADQRGSTPSNAAELLVPDRQNELRYLTDIRITLHYAMQQQLIDTLRSLHDAGDALHQAMSRFLQGQERQLVAQTKLLQAYDPNAALKRGYAVLRADQTVVSSILSLALQQTVTISLQDGTATAVITGIEKE